MTVTKDVGPHLNCVADHPLDGELAAVDGPLLRESFERLVQQSQAVAESGQDFLKELKP